MMASTVKNAIDRLRNGNQRRPGGLRVPQGQCARRFGFEPRGPFLKGPKKFSHPESHCKISNLMITEPFYSHLFSMKRGSLHTRMFRRIHLSVFRKIETKNGFAGPKSFRASRETDPWPGTLHCVLVEDTLLSRCLSPPRCINEYRWIQCWGCPCDGPVSHTYRGKQK